jgi:F0F1-type ATP synthase assembly protein I
VIKFAIGEDGGMQTRIPAAARLLGIGWYLAISIVGGIVGGLLLDGWLDTKPLFTLLGLVLGMVVAFYGAYKALRQVMAETSSKTKGTDED